MLRDASVFFSFRMSIRLILSAASQHYFLSPRKERIVSVHAIYPHAKSIHFTSYWYFRTFISLKLKFCFWNVLYMWIPSEETFRTRWISDTFQISLIFNISINLFHSIYYVWNCLFHCSKLISLYIWNIWNMLFHSVWNCLCQSDLKITCFTHFKK